jgi:hypothetical protein
LLRTEIFTGILTRRVPVFERIELFRRSLESKVEFVTVMWCESLEAVKAFAGEDFEVAVVPAAARTVLSHFDARSQHYEVREQLAAHA